MAATWQQVFALDARYNAYRAPNNANFRTLYIRRRNQLLKETVQNDFASFRKLYLKLRSLLLQQRYGNIGGMGSTCDQVSLRSKINKGYSKLFSGSCSWGGLCKGLSSPFPFVDHGADHLDYFIMALVFKPLAFSEGASEAPQEIQAKHEQATRVPLIKGPGATDASAELSSGTSETNVNSVVPTKQANASRAIVGGTSISENYAFVGVHHIFDQHNNCVTMIKFANNDRSKLCCASYDGTVSICNVTSTPPKVEVILRGHGKAVTSCDWSVSNDLVVTSSFDCTVRLWNCQTGKCLRVVQDDWNAEVLSCVFQPANNNMVVAGNAKGLVFIVNISAGISSKGGSVKVGGKVLSIACDSTGKQIWAGTDKGTIFSFWFEADTGKLLKKKKIVVAENTSISCISWKTWISREARNPSLLVSCSANVLCLFRVVDLDGSLQLKKKFAVRHSKELVRSSFCPIMSFRQGACIVTGSEDSCVYFFDVERDEKPVVNKLQGHSCPVLGVSFNYDESLLATSDVQGLIIIWKRATETDSS